MSGGLAKLAIHEKIYSGKEKSSCFIDKIKQNEKSTYIYKDECLDDWAMNRSYSEQ